jgi:hypothetical protein
LFNSSYVPNNPSLILDTALWKSSGEVANNQQPSSSDQTSPLLHLQPIVVEHNPTTHEEETIFLHTEEGRN